MLDLLGSGQYGDVHEALWTTSNNNSMEVAVKKLKKGSSTLERIRFLQEAAIMAQFSNPNVLGIMGVIKQEEDVCHLTFIIYIYALSSMLHKLTCCFFFFKTGYDYYGADV